MTSEQDWDQQQALKSAMGKHDLLVRLVLHLIAQLTADGSNLQQAIRQLDWDGITYLSHSLKGACAQLHANSLRHCCEKLEKAAKQQQNTLLPPLLEEFDRLMPVLVKRLQGFIEQSTN